LREKAKGLEYKISIQVSESSSVRAYKKQKSREQPIQLSFHTSAWIKILMEVVILPRVVDDGGVVVITVVVTVVLLVVGSVVEYSRESICEFKIIMKKA